MRRTDPFVASGAIAIFAFTHRFVAGPEFAPVAVACGASARRHRPRRVVCALTVVTPVTAEVRSIVQEPVPPDGRARIRAT